jgi:predicted ATPase/class 3 adenylate cyclase
MAAARWNTLIVEPVPTGTVTFLFTDVEGSTRLWQADREAMAAALTLHDEIVRGAIESCRGYVFSTAGDSFAAAFWTADEALAAANAAQVELGAVTWPEPAVIRVRMGVHTGTASERAGDYFGPTVNLAARVADAGHGGQVLVSDAAARLVSSRPLRRLGEHRLKDVAGPEVLWQLGDDEFPPLRTQPTRLGNLPRATRSFVGQIEECARLVTLARPGQLVTLTGVGGVGKTRLALEAATTLRPDFAQGVWWCDLATLDDPASLVGAVASMLSLAMQPGLTPLESLVDGLDGRSVLIILDNCEHLTDGVAAIVEAIMADCTTVAILATSREPLGVEAEHVWPVRSLDPDLEGVPLFHERAVAADASFVPANDRPTVLELCRHLDGIPLAIELAAAKVRVMTPVEMLEGLSDRFGLLRGGARRALDRHRTLTATLDWSYDLLSAPEQVLLDRLSVFAGTFDAAAVKALCAFATLADTDVFELMTLLVNKSLVVAERAGGRTRYRLLETVRQYAEGHAAANGELAELRARHLDYYVELTAAAGVVWLGDFARGQDVFDTEWDNIRAATQIAIAKRDTEALERIFVALHHSIIATLRYEVADWVTDAANLVGAGPVTYATAAMFAGLLGDFERCEELARAGLGRAGSASTEDRWCLVQLYVALVRTGRTDDALEALATAQRLAQDAGDVIHDAAGSSVLAFRLVARDPAAAAQWARRAEDLIAASGHPMLRTEVLSGLTRYYSLVGNPTRGLECAHEALALAEEVGLTREAHHARNALAQLAARGGLDNAVPALRAAVTAAYADRAWYDLWPTMPVLAEYWIANGHRDAAAVVVGYLDSYHLFSLGDAARDRLGRGPDVRLGKDKGAKLDRDQLVAFVLGHLPLERDHSPQPE